MNDPSPAGRWDGPAILVEGLQKSFGEVHALRGIDLVAERGTVLCVLGPNGAGKTTAVKILTTLLAPDGGRALVEGRDVVRSAPAVREIIGLAGQAAAIQEELTGRENLEIMGRLHHLSKGESRRRAVELLEQFDLVAAADRPAKGYSGGMARRLDLAVSLVAQPRVLFLDEPTSGLDPRSRIGMWGIIRQLVSDGATLLLTTQHLEEADELSNEIVVIDQGKVIAAGTGDSLKNRIGGAVVRFVVVDRTRVGHAVEVVRPLAEGEPTVDEESARVTIRVGSRGSDSLVQAVRLLDGAGIHAEDLGIHRPSLDDVFLALTGHTAEDGSRQVRRGSRQGRRGGLAPETETWRSQ